MTDNEIIKVLGKLYYGGHSCMNCKYRITEGDNRCGIKGCNIAINTFDLINRQKAELEHMRKLQKPTETSGFVIEDNRIVFYTNILNGYRHEYVTLGEIARELNGLLHAAYKNDEVLSHYKGKLQTAKAEAVKEFAEKAVIELTANYSDKYCHWIDDTIDNLVKEMTEVSDGTENRNCVQ